MPWRRCLERDCSAPALRGTRCELHRKARNAARDATRPTAVARGYISRTHRDWRAAVLARDPECVEPGCTQPSTDADHIVPLRQGGTWDLDNGRGLCHAHHAAWTARTTRFGR